jgi:lipoate-protein ligase A
MHGEYKVPGGKLVVIDLEIINDQIANLRLSGDFFLEPEEALDWISHALNGLPSNTSTALIEECVATALEHAELLGITPNGVAIAVQRALGGVA